MTPLILALPGGEDFAETLVERLPAESCRYQLHRFPDGESHVRVDTPVAGRDVVVVAPLAQPDERLVPLFLTATTLSALQARRILLVAPYLPYMRQDHAFHPGEGVAAQYIAHWISGFADSLVTVEPHLHRIHDLESIYTIPCEVVHAGPAIAHWIGENVQRPMIVGPDVESRPWCEVVARELECPLVVLHKVRHGDRDVEISVADLPACTDYTPVLIDDIISSGQTLAVAIRQLRSAGYPQPVCIGVHALFGQDTIDLLHSAGADRVVSCNTLHHRSNAIELNRSIVAAVRSLLERMSKHRT